MPVTSTMTIGGETVDLNAPCDVVAALRKVEIKIASGGQRMTVKIDDDEVTYNRANLSGLQDLISRYDRLCRAANGQKVRRRAISVRHV